jgi:hypothetical protein
VHEAANDRSQLDGSRRVRTRTVRPLLMRVSPYINQVFLRNLRLSSGNDRSTTILHTFSASLLLIHGSISLFARREIGKQIFGSFSCVDSGASSSAGSPLLFGQWLKGSRSCAFCDGGSYCWYCSFVMRYDGSSPHRYLSLYYHCWMRLAWHGVDRGVVAESVISKWEFLLGFRNTVFYYA